MGHGAAAFWCPPRIDFRSDEVIDYASAELRERREAQEEERGRGGAFEWFAAAAVAGDALHSAQGIGGRPRSAMIRSHDPPSGSNLSLLLAARAAQY